MGALGGGRKRQVREATVERKDGSAGKRNPHSIRLALLAIRKFWNFKSTEKVKFRNVFEFVEHFQPIYERVVGKYPNYEKPKNAEQNQRVISRLESGSASYSYIDLRCYAEFVGIPTSLLLIYTHMIGLLKQDDIPIDVVKLFLSRIERSTSDLRVVLEGAPNAAAARQAFFTKMPDNNDGRLNKTWELDIEKLAILASSFNDLGVADDLEVHEQFKLWLQGRM